MTTLDEIRARDAEIRYCDQCGNRYRDGDTHDRSAEECRSGGCLAPEDHHPYVAGPIPDYEQAEQDRRDLLRMLDELER